MEPRFSFHDFVGYTIPGGIALLLLYWFGVGFAALDFNFQVNGLGESILFIGASYVLRHLVQGFGDRFESEQVVR